ncbi:hypothetical protein OIV83_002144 [Microbotryomycetes sp. JL201]|nr:hypothetical protein OIV83_002144 [Microbotryomycetes sp. JL201]
MDASGWSLTESDPAVFTGILKELGVEGLIVEELYGLDDDLLASLQPIKAFIFLFKYVGRADRIGCAGTPKEPPVPHYFAHQVINNACATLALLNAAMNVEDGTTKLGSELESLKAFSRDLDPDSRGWTISNSERIREVHNSFARSDPFHLEEPRDSEQAEDAYHFICYLPIGDSLYELDGLQALPIAHGTVGPNEDWTNRARQVIQERISTYPAGELMFNLMAVTARPSFLRNKIQQAEASASGFDVAAEKAELERIETRLSEWDIDTTLKRHNHIGLVTAVLKELARTDKLNDRISAARDAMRNRTQA